MIKFVVDNWYVLLLALMAVCVVGYLVYKFLKFPHGEQISKVKEWLLLAVAEAERELGSGTGQLKLRYVYDMFVTKFPYLVKFVPFEMFSDLVDEVLIKFKEMFKTNAAVRKYVDNTVEHKDEV